MTLPLLMMMGCGAGVEDVTWANWDEVAEASLAGGSQGGDLYICLMKNTNAGGNEIGLANGLSEANRTLTQAGTLAGMVGGWRTFDGANDLLGMTSTLFDAFICNANKTWTIIEKVHNVGVNGSFLYGASDPATEIIHMYSGGTRQIDNAFRQDNVYDYAASVNNAPASTEYYVASWADGTTLRTGFTTTRPTKLSDFAADDMVLLDVNTGDYSGETFNGAERTIGGTSWLDFDLGYIVMGKVCLIDNGS